VPSLVSPVLVGRQAELQFLSGALNQVVAGEQVTVVVGGEAGVGKSRLVQELIAGTRDTGMRVLVGGCVELDGGGIPFAPVVEMIRALASELPDPELNSVLGPARAEIGRLVPELGNDHSSAPAADPDPSRMLELLVGVVGRLSAAQPLLLWFEDLQWADRSTLDLLALLVARGGRHLLVVLTVRSDELHRAHPFRRISARWDQQRLVERLELERLAPSGVAAQVEAILGERPDGELVDFVSERSEGIPLFVEELLGAVRDGRVDHDYLPPSLRDVLLARAELLSPSGQHILRVVSAATRWVPDRLLAPVAGLADAELRSAVREAVEQQLLVIDASGRSYGFRHALARAAIHDDLLPGERAQLHQAYAEAIANSPALAGTDLDASSMLAHHWLAAHDLPRALSAAVRAGNAAAAASPPAAQRHFEIALELWNQVPDAEQRAGIDHVQLLELAADTAAPAGAVDRALALVDQALAEVGEGVTTERRATLLVRRGELLLDLGRDAEGLAEYEQAERLLERHQPGRMRALVLGSFARALARVDQMEPARDMAERALEAIRGVDAPEERLRIQLTLGPAMVYGGDTEAGVGLMHNVGVEAERSGLWWISARALVALTDTQLMLGRYDEVVDTADRGIALAERSGVDRTMGAFLRGNKAEALLRLGRLNEAMASAVRGAEAPGVFAAAMLMVRAETHVVCGRAEECRADMREVRRHLRNSSSAQFTLPVAWIEAELARSGGDLGQAREIVHQALARTDVGDEQRYRWPLISLGARVEAERALAARDIGEDAEDAQRRIGALRDEADRTPAITPADQGHLALTHGEHARAQGHSETEAWSVAVQACREMNEALPLTYALLRHAEALTVDGDTDAAAAPATEALKLAQAMGAPPLYDELQALVRRARLSVGDDDSRTASPAPTAAAPDEFEQLGLTAREVEVLLLIADGCSNSQIAEQLVISRKTASAHVSHILAKLGVATRVEAAALAHRRGLARASADV
jgi:DNA-binding CsgD family transcriptional regulator/tetratricopeptide (TPR) repeat protein